MLIALHKPFGVLCQFSKGSHPGEPTLADVITQPDVYPAGRLDKNSEGLLLLTDNGALQHRISHPNAGTEKEYWVQLEGQPSNSLADALCAGQHLKDGPARAAGARALNSSTDLQRITEFGDHPGQLPAHRQANSHWLAVTMTSGKNRIVRRLCAALGYPVLRLIRVRIGAIELGELQAGESRPERWD